MFRRNFLALGFVSAFTGKLFSGEKTKVNPKGLPVVKFAPEDENCNSIITNEFELFGTTPWTKTHWDKTPTGITYPWDKPYDDETNKDRHFVIVRKTVCWLDQKDMIIHNHWIQKQISFFWGEVLCTANYHVGVQSLSLVPYVSTTFSFTENSQWLRIKCRSTDFHKFSTYQKG